jgi:hypothetical protein
VADQRDQIDLRTLEEVRRLLSSSDFATADDRLAHVGSDGLAGTPTNAPGATSFEPSSSAPPLPRRR